MHGKKGIFLLKITEKEGKTGPGGGMNSIPGVLPMAPGT